MSTAKLDIHFADQSCQQQDSSYGNDSLSSGRNTSSLGNDDIADRGNTLGRDEFSGGNTSGSGLGRDEYSSSGRDTYGSSNTGSDNFGSSNTGRDTYGSSNTDRDTYGSSNTGRDNFSSSNDNYDSSNTGNTGYGSSNTDDFGHHHKSAGERLGEDELKPRHGIERDTHHTTGGNYPVSSCMQESFLPYLLHITLGLSMIILLGLSYPTPMLLLSHFTTTYTSTSDQRQPC